MAGLYLHIPFCKQACHYCDFHFSTSLKKKDDMVTALIAEMTLRRSEIKEPLETIYFGGGTPSLLSKVDLDRIFKAVYDLFEVTEAPEITLEANPDDLSLDQLKVLASSPINRLSIGIQSFFEEDLQLMNRAHSAKEAEEVLINAKRFFENISVDLIYGIPGMNVQRWKTNMMKAFESGIPHVSCYALTVEPKTALKKFIQTGQVAPIDDEMAYAHYQALQEFSKEFGFTNYEFSNYGKPGYESRNNLAYWFGKPYLGIGPSAHSFDGKVRSWNISNNSLYLKGITEGKLPLETETLTKNDAFNEYVMTRLRTQWGLDRDEVINRFGMSYWEHILRNAKSHFEAGNLQRTDSSIVVSAAGKFLSDGIASDLFFIPFNENN